jgi:hypothetical protein
MVRVRAVVAAQVRDGELLLRIGAALLDRRLELLDEVRLLEELVLEELVERVVRLLPLSGAPS